MPNQNAIVDFAVIGGGAAGFFAAITYAEQRLRQVGKPGKIVIIEKANRPLGKVLISGGGRCNLTHACFDPTELAAHYPRGAAELRGAFHRFQPGDIIAWFESRGVRLKTEADGRVFPASDSAQSVTDCLLEAARQAGIKLWTQATITAIEAPKHAKDSFLLHLRYRQVKAAEVDKPSCLTARKVLLATGGEAGGMKLAAALGHTIESPVPSLFTFRLADSRLEGLAGVSVPLAELRLQGGTGKLPDQARQPQHGAVLITHWGLSGPGVLKLSAWAARWLHSMNYQATLLVNWLFPLQEAELLEILLVHKAETPAARQKVSSCDPFQRLPQRLWQRLTQAAGIAATQRWADLSKETLKRLAGELTAGRFAILGKGPFKEEFVTCGGVSLREVDFRTMQSRLAPGLFFAGEVLDIDGLTGGFNLQNAWTTGWIAGMGAAIEDGR